MTLVSDGGMAIGMMPCKVCQSGNFLQQHYCVVPFLSHYFFNIRFGLPAIRLVVGQHFLPEGRRPAIERDNGDAGYFLIGG